MDERSAKRKIAKWNNLHPTNVTEKTEWIVEHFMHHVVSLLNCEAKAMIVTASRPAVIRYKYAIEAYLRAHPGYDRAQVERHLAFHVPGDPLMAFSGKVRGEELHHGGGRVPQGQPVRPHQTRLRVHRGQLQPKGDGQHREGLRRARKQAPIVANKFQTGFDQKKLVAIYVDKPLGNNIEIVQTYSRVNRTYPGKDQVFVVDFVNDPEKVYRAFKTYDNGAKMSGTQDLNIVTDVKADLDAEGMYSEAELDGFKESLYRSKVAAADGGSDAYRAALYRAVEDPAARFNNAFLAAKDAYETNMQAKEDAEAAGDIERAAQAAMDVADAEQDVARLQTFKKKLSKYVSSYTFITQLVDLGEPDLEVFYSFAKLLSHKIKGSALDDVDITGLVLKDYRISEQKKPEREVEGEELQPMGAGGSGAAPRRDTIARIIDRLNQTWGSEGNPIVKARVVNHIADEVAADPVTVMRVTNSNNSKDAVLADDRLGNQVVVSLINLMSNEFASLADQALNDPQALEPLKEQVYDLIRSGRRIDIAELASYVAEHNGER
ncbi:MAG: hypothetical protein V8S24_08520 [Gordonibacter pamelaeae]